jgi:hypothetical protein
MMTIDVVTATDLAALVTNDMVTCVNYIVSRADAIINMTVETVRIVLTVINEATDAATLDGMIITAAIEIVIVTFQGTAVAATHAVRPVAHRPSAMTAATRLAVEAAVRIDTNYEVTYAMAEMIVTEQIAIVVPTVSATARALTTRVPSMKVVHVQIVQVHLRRLTAARW